MRKLRKICLIVCVLAICIGGAGCSSEKNVKKIKDLEYTVCPDKDLSKELLDIINEKKDSPFKLTYSDSSTDGTPEYLYIIVGMGEQPTGGYSLSVKELFEAENAIYFKYGFMGPSKTDEIPEGVSCPYIVVKVEYSDKPVVFR